MPKYACVRLAKTRNSTCPVYFFRKFNRLHRARSSFFGLDKQSDFEQINSITTDQRQVAIGAVHVVGFFAGGDGSFKRDFDFSIHGSSRRC